MKFGPIETTDKLGRTLVLRNAEPEDADMLLEYLRKTSAETPFLLREPDEVKITREQEIKFIQRQIEADRDLFLIATYNDKLVGNCSLMSHSSYRKLKHRCNVAIAIYQEYWGNGIGEILLKTVLEIAKKVGYEQAELDVVSTNSSAISLYKKLGFETYGRFPDFIKSSDGSYTDGIWMMKKL
ncbi:MAG: GNAT family N-acetyltransferase [Eubacteriales bacterium]|nr:GNAT family N-acetyltransferase [Eubacteriales bacterium]